MENYFSIILLFLSLLTLDPKKNEENFSPLRQKWVIVNHKLIIYW